MLPVISEVETHKKHSSKNLQISRKIRSSHRKCSAKIGVLKSFTNFTGKRLCWRLSFIKFKRQTCYFIKKKLQHWCFSVKFAKFLGAPILKSICDWVPNTRLERFVQNTPRKELAIAPVKKCFVWQNCR